MEESTNAKMPPQHGCLESYGQSHPVSALGLSGGKNALLFMSSFLPRCLLIKRNMFKKRDTPVLYLHTNTA